MYLEFENNQDSNWSPLAPITSSGLLGYPFPRIGRAGVYCYNECKRKKGLKWNKGGKECYNSCKNKFKAAKKDAKYEEMGLADLGEGGLAGIFEEPAPQQNIVDDNAGMRTDEEPKSTINPMVIGGIIFFLLVVVGLIIYLKKSK
jgi:hypothetical protein